MPVEGSRWRACTARMEGAVCSTAAARSLESDSRASIRVLLAGESGPSMPEARPSGNPPNGQVRTDPGPRGGASANGGLRAASRADVVERVEEAIDVGRIAVHVRRDANAAFPAPDEHASRGKPGGEAGGVVGQEADVAGPAGGALGGDDGEAAAAQPLDERASQVMSVTLHVGSR